MIGTSLSHFKITAKLGEGGMGEVYRAEDTKLGRDVAIKVLPEEFTQDPERLARFKREAKVLASLNHPHIGAIYSFETATAGTETFNFLVMELIDGNTLQELIKKSVPMERALEMAAQVASALEEAHEQGIVHRDLKPANVKVTPAGVVKVLDFGLAKAWAPDPSDPRISASPTLTAQMTQAGMILGTAAYMSPEQARGQEVDKRADIWSFGVLVFEMLSGQDLFAGDTVTDTLAAVVRAEPDFALLPKSTPNRARTLLERCLEKDPAVRLRDIGEARIALEGAEPETVSVESDAKAPRASKLWQAVLWVAVGVALGGLAMIGINRNPRSDSTVDTLHYSIQPLEGTIAGTEDTNGLDISRDGDKIVYVGTEPNSSNTLLFLKTDAEAEPRPIPETEGARAPFFSPDGQWVGFFSDRELLKISLLGGSPMSIASTGDRRGGVWHPDGTIYYVADSVTPLVQISESGGEVSRVTTLDDERRERTHRWPALVPGGKAILFTSDTHTSTEYYDDARIEAVVLETGERKVVLDGSSRAVAISSGHLIFARDGSLFQQPFDLDKLEVSGSPQLAVQGVLTVVVSGAVQFAISETGTLAYVPGDKTTEVFDLVWITPEGETETASTERGVYLQVSLSPQGDRAVMTGATRVAQDLWILDMERESMSRFTFEASNSDPIWTPDGKGILFSSNRSGSHVKPYLKSADGIGEAQLLWDAPSEAFTMDVSNDGRWLAVELNRFHTDQDQGTQIWIVDVTGENEPFPFFEDRFNNTYASFSPDDRWLAYISSENGEDHVYVRPYPSADGKWQISQVMAREPRWTPDGKRLFYRTTEGLKYVTVDTSEGFRASRPVLVKPGGIGAPFNRTYSFAPDGERLLALSPHLEDQPDWRVHVIRGWESELTRR